MKRELIKQLNRELANRSLLYTKLHNYHWNIKGEHFFTLHTKFEELYTEAAETIDTIAERILAIEGEPVATLREQLNLATVQEASGGEDAQQMVTIIANDFDTLNTEADKVIKLAEEAEDAVTADLFTQYKEGLQKHIWMLNAFLGK